MRLTKQELSQLKHIKEEIRLLQKAIADIEYEYVTDSVKGSSKHFPFVEHTIMITGADVEGHDRKARRLKAQLERRESDLLDKRAEIEEFIDTIDDSFIRQIIALRYISCFQWEQVAAHMGSGYTVNCIKKQHERFMRKEEKYETYM